MNELQTKSKMRLRNVSRSRETFGPCTASCAAVLLLRNC